MNDQPSKHDPREYQLLSNIFTFQNFNARGKDELSLRLLHQVMENTCQNLGITFEMSDSEILENLAGRNPSDHLQDLRKLDAYVEANSVEDVIRIAREQMDKNASIENNGIYHEFGVQLIRFSKLYDQLPDHLNKKKLYPEAFEKARMAFEFYERLRALVKIANILKSIE